MLPSLWNNNTPGFPITTAQANGERPENMGVGGGVVLA